MNFLRGLTINFTMRFIPKHYGSYFYVDPSHVEKIPKVKKICVTPILYLSKLIRNFDPTQDPTRIFPLLARILDSEDFFLILQSILFIARRIHRRLPRYLIDISLALFLYVY